MGNRRKHVSTPCASSIPHSRSLSCSCSCSLPIASPTNAQKTQPSENIKHVLSFRTLHLQRSVETRRKKELYEEKAGRSVRRFVFLSFWLTHIAPSHSPLPLPLPLLLTQNLPPKHLKRPRLRTHSLTHLGQMNHGMGSGRSTKAEANHTLPLLSSSVRLCHPQYDLPAISHSFLPLIFRSTMILESGVCPLSGLSAFIPWHALDG